MEKKFSIYSSAVPSKQRAKGLQGVGGKVQTVAIGLPTQSAAEVVNIYNTYTTTDKTQQMYKGKISIANLLALSPGDIGPDDLYLVFAEGSNESGWSKDSTFVLNGQNYPDGTFVARVDESWVPQDSDIEVESKSIKLDVLPSDLWLFESAYEGSYANLYGEGTNGGIKIGRIANYCLDSDGSYKPKMATKGEPGSRYYSESNTRTLYVPYARYYQSGGETVYTGGALSAEDYKKLIEGGGVSVPIDKTIPSSPSNERVPSTKLFVDLAVLLMGNQNISGEKFFLDKIGINGGIDIENDSGACGTLYGFSLGKLHLSNPATGADNGIVLIGQMGRSTKPVYIGTDYKTKECDMSSYETASHASATYQPKGDYLNKATADTYYQPIGDYLDTATANASYVKTSGGSFIRPNNQIVFTFDSIVNKPIDIEYRMGTRLGLLRVDPSKNSRPIWVDSAGTEHQLFFADELEDDILIEFRRNDDGTYTGYQLTGKTVEANLVYTTSGTGIRDCYKFSFQNNIGKEDFTISASLGRDSESYTYDMIMSHEQFGSMLRFTTAMLENNLEGDIMKFKQMEAGIYRSIYIRIR